MIQNHPIYQNYCLVNTARGELIENVALLKYLKNGKIGAVALDTIEGENGILHKDWHRLVPPGARDVPFGVERDKREGVG
ncbi:MAG: NAD(P)-dependent oxidoreductase, partial [Waterburya sp.]